MRKTASPLVTGSFVAALVAVTSATPSQASAPQIEETGVSTMFQNSTGTEYQVADIGYYFDHFTSIHPDNKLLKDIDNIYTSLLSELLDAEKNNSPDDYSWLFSDFRKNMYESYISTMAEITESYNRNYSGIPTITERIDICTSLAIQDFYGLFNRKFFPYARENYNLSDSFENRISELSSAIQKLKDANNAELEKIKKEGKPAPCNLALS